MIDQLASLCESNGYAGIQIDFEGAPPAEREPFTAWITALAARLHSIGDKLSTVVTAKYYNITSGRAAMYNDAALSVPSDYIFVLDWGLHWTTSTPGGLAELPWFTKVADYTATMPNKSKFVLGMPMYGLDWPNGGGSANPATPLEFNNVDGGAERVRGAARMGTDGGRTALLLHRLQRCAPRRVVHRPAVAGGARPARRIARPRDRAVAPRQRGPVHLGTAPAGRLRARGWTS